MKRRYEPRPPLRRHFEAHAFIFDCCRFMPDAIFLRRLDFLLRR
jgi:hypothetical protein